MYTYDISFPEHAEKLVHPDHLLTTHCPVHIGELVILGDGSESEPGQPVSFSDYDVLLSTNVPDVTTTTTTTAPPTSVDPAITTPPTAETTVAP